MLIPRIDCDPDSVTTIDNYAFFGCTSLASIEIPDSVMTIGEYAFHGCTCLASIGIPNCFTTCSNVFEIMGDPASCSQIHEEQRAISTRG
jgi:hypothetical protein